MAMEKLAEQIDRLESLIAAMFLPVPADIHLKALKEALPDIKNELKQAYAELGGERFWD